MMKRVVRVLSLLLLVFAPHAEGTRFSLPGKPALTSCRSPEKETFTCWWRAGSDGGLPTKYALYYGKENSDTVYECPDYHTAGENSCFFNKNDTSIWVNYNITVVASNALGSSFSDPVDIDVVYIVQPNPPEKLSLTVLEDKGWPFLRVSWEPPRKADTRSGWITLIYEIRIKLDEENDWETHVAGQQKMFNIFSLRSGATYLVQVRCKPDHGFWSEWTSASDIRFPNYFHREKSVWILIAIFSAFTFLILTWLIYMNSHSMKHCLLPPVPGPKIKGFDKQLLKNGKSDEVFHALVVCDFPPTSSSNYEDLLVEYLEVYVPEEQELIQEESKNVREGCLKSESTTSDSDSGRGSCDSHTLLMDKCRETKEVERQTDQEERQTGKESQRHQKNWEQEALTCGQEDVVRPDLTSGRVKTWPSLYSPLPQYSSRPLEQRGSLEMAKQYCFSDSLFPTGTTSSHLTRPGHSNKEVPVQSHSEFSLSTRQPHLLHPQREIRRQLRTHSDVNISSIGRKQAPAGIHSPAHRANEYVEVQRVNEKNMVLLQPVVPGPGRRQGCPLVLQQRDYSKVRRVDSDNMLLLQREVDVMEGDVDMCPCEETNAVTEGFHTSSTMSTTQKPTACHHAAMPLQEERILAGSGYVDTANMFTMPTY